MPWEIGFWFAAIVGAAAVLAIGIWNGVIGWDYIHKGQVTGDDIGGTGRYVSRHSRDPRERFFIAADDVQFKYYSWGWPSMWEDRLRMFTASDYQVGGVIPPTSLGQFSASTPFTVFTRSDLWSQVKDEFTSRYPGVRVDPITPDGRLLAVSVT